jgi:hypothetical protein
VAILLFLLIGCLLTGLLYRRLSRRSRSKENWKY